MLPRRLSVHRPRQGLSRPIRPDWSLAAASGTLRGVRRSWRPHPNHHRQKGVTRPAENLRKWPVRAKPISVVTIWPVAPGASISRRLNVPSRPSSSIRKSRPPSVGPRALPRYSKCSPSHLGRRRRSGERHSQPSATATQSRSPARTAPTPLQARVIAGQESRVAGPRNPERPCENRAFRFSRPRFERPTRLGTSGPVWPVALMSGMLTSWPHPRAQHRSPKRGSMISISIARRIAPNGAGALGSWLRGGCRARVRDWNASASSTSTASSCPPSCRPTCCLSRTRRSRPGEVACLGPG